jgi:hypothetical protein
MNMFLYVNFHLPVVAYIPPTTCRLDELKLEESSNLTERSALAKTWHHLRFRFLKLKSRFRLRLAFK